MPVDSEALIQRHLRPGERLVWTGRPPAWRLALPGLPGLIFISVWSAMAFSMLAPMLKVYLPPLSSGVEPSGGALFPLAFVGIFVVAGGSGFIWHLRKLLSSWRHYYALTDQRALIIVDLWPSSVKSYGPSAFSEMSRSGDQQHGSIKFGTPRRWTDPEIGRASCRERV